jgi:hypothetical protein
MADAKKPKNPQYNTPVVTFGPFPKITAPDFKFKPEKGEFVLRGILPTDHPVAMKMRTLADEIADKALKVAVEKDERPAAKKKQTPWKLNESKVYTDEVDDEGNETGRTVFKFSMLHSGVSKKTGKAWKMWPKLFDANGKAIPREKNADYDLKVWGGSEGIVRFEAVPYAATANVGAGCKFSLVAVQITKLVEGGDGSSAEDFGFGKVEGGFDSDSIAPQEETMETASADMSSDNAPTGENDDF